MAAEIVSPPKKDVDMDQLSAEMLEMKTLLVSLSPAAQPETSSPASNFATSPPDMSLLGATDSFTLQDEVAKIIQDNIPSDLKNEVTVSSLTQKVLAAVEKRIPHLTLPENARQGHHLLRGQQGQMHHGGTQARSLPRQV